MPKVSDERKTERREQILSGARLCFAENGYEGVTVARLEEEIGLSSAPAAATPIGNS